MFEFLIPNDIYPDYFNPFHARYHSEYFYHFITLDDLHHYLYDVCDPSDFNTPLVGFIDAGGDENYYEDYCTADEVYNFAVAVFAEHSDE